MPSAVGTITLATDGWDLVYNKEQQLIKTKKAVYYEDQDAVDTYIALLAESKKFGHNLVVDLLNVPGVITDIHTSNGERILADYLLIFYARQEIKEHINLVNNTISFKYKYDHISDEHLQLLLAKIYQVDASDLAMQLEPLLFDQTFESFMQLIDTPIPEASDDDENVERIMADYIYYKNIFQTLIREGIENAELENTDLQLLEENSAYYSDSQRIGYECCFSRRCNYEMIGIRIDILPGNKFRIDFGDYKQLKTLEFYNLLLSMERLDSNARMHLIAFANLFLLYGEYDKAKLLAEILIPRYQNPVSVGKESVRKNLAKLFSNFQYSTIITSNKIIYNVASFEIYADKITKFIRSNLDAVKHMYLDQAESGKLQNSKIRITSLTTPNLILENLRQILSAYYYSNDFEDMLLEDY